jgi:hypothetical protein
MSEKLHWTLRTAIYFFIFFCLINMLAYWQSDMIDDGWVIRQPGIFGWPFTYTKEFFMALFFILLLIYVVASTLIFWHRHRRL